MFKFNRKSTQSKRDTGIGGEQSLMKDHATEARADADQDEEFIMGGKRKVGDTIVGYYSMKQNQEEDDAAKFKREKKRAEK